MIQHWSKVSQQLSNTSGFSSLGLISHGSGTLSCLAWTQKVVAGPQSWPQSKYTVPCLCVSKRSQLQTYPVQWRDIWALGTDIFSFENNSHGINWLHLKVAFVLPIQLGIPHLCYLPGTLKVYILYISLVVSCTEDSH